MEINIGPSELETFIAVAEFGSFSKAAARLGLSQPTVTNRIQKLESTLGLPLFNRTTRRVTTTEAGERLRLRAEHTVAELKALVQDFRDEIALRHGRVALVATPAVSATVLPRVIRHFLKRHPGVNLTLHDEFALKALARISAQEFDFAVVPYTDPGTDFEFEPLFSDEFFLVVPREHPLAKANKVDFADISRYPLLSRPPGSAIRTTLTEEFSKRNLRFEPAFESTSLFTLLGLVEAGLGLSLLPQMITPRLNLNAVKMVRIGGTGIFRQIGIMKLRQRRLSPSAAAFARALRSILRDRVTPAVEDTAPGRPPARPAARRPKRNR